MALIDNAVEGLIGSLITGTIALLAMWYTRRSRESRQEEAWQRRAEELEKLIAKRYGNEIAYLRRMYDRCQDECRRLNRIITRLNRGGDEQ